jgi:hypothetical protein
MRANLHMNDNSLATNAQQYFVFPTSAAPRPGAAASFCHPFDNPYLERMDVASL